MENAKQKVQIIELSTDVSRQDKTGGPAVAFAGHKIHSRPSETLPPLDLEQPSAEKLEKGKKFDKAQLINKLNYINFQDGTILVNFKHPKYDKTISIKATPQPCMGDLVDCLWSEDKKVSQIIQSYDFNHLLITNGQKLLKVEAELVKIDTEGVFCRKFVMKPVPAKSGAMPVMASRCS